MKKPRVVILAGGEGKRFHPFVTNKTLFPFLGKPVLQHVIELSIKAGLTDFLIATNESNEQWLKTYSPKGISIKTKIVKPLGMADALLNLEEEIANDPILIMNAVDLVDVSLLKQILTMSQKSTIIIPGLKVNKHTPAGYLKINGNKVEEIVEKPNKGSEPSNLINLVFHYFTEPKQFIELLKETSTETDDQYERALNALIKQTGASYIEYEKYWGKLKHPHFVLDMTELFLGHYVPSYKSKTAYVSPKATVEGNVYIDDNAKIYEGAVIKGPCYIGKNVTVGNHTLIRSSIIEEGTVVGFGSEVARSYVGPQCNLHHNFIGDSVLEGEINPSWGTCTGNWRLFDNNNVSLKFPEDRLETSRNKLGAIIAKGALFGINCSIMPGITIGANAHIYPATVVRNSVKENTTLKSSQAQEIVE